MKHFKILLNPYFISPEQADVTGDRFLVTVDGRPIGSCPTLTDCAEILDSGKHIFI